jgi:hypothetical protein
VIVLKTIVLFVSTLTGVACFAWACAITPPSKAACPTGWWIPEGVRRSGDFTCRPVPVGDTERLANGRIVDHSVQPVGEREMHVICGVGAVPVIAVDGRTVSCR